MHDGFSDKLQTMFNFCVYFCEESIALLFIVELCMGKIFKEVFVKVSEVNVAWFVKACAIMRRLAKFNKVFDVF